MSGRGRGGWLSTGVAPSPRCPWLYGLGLGFPICGQWCPCGRALGELRGQRGGSPVQPPPTTTPLPALCSRRGGDRCRQGRNRQGGCRRGLGETVTLSPGRASVRAGGGRRGKLALQPAHGLEAVGGAPGSLHFVTPHVPRALSPKCLQEEGAAPPGLLPRPACPPLPTDVTPTSQGLPRREHLPGLRN